MYYLDISSMSASESGMRLGPHPSHLGFEIPNWPGQPLRSFLKARVDLFPFVERQRRLTRDLGFDNGSRGDSSDL